MCKLSFIFCLKLVFLGLCFAQDDSVIFKLLDENKNDTAAAAECYEEGFKVRNSDPDLTIQLAEAGYHIARRCASDYWMGKNMMLWGLGYYKKGDWKKSVPYYFKAIQIQKQVPDSAGLLYTYINLGNALEEGKFINQADSVFHLALFLAEKLNKKSDRIRILNNLGVLYSGIREFQTALSLLFEARKEALSINNYELLAMSCNNYAGVLLLNEKWQQARPWLEDALKYYSLTENPFGKADAMVNLFQINVREGLIKESEELLKEIEVNKKWLEIAQNRKEFLKWKSAFMALKGDSGLAFRLLLKHIHLADSLQNLPSNSNINKFFEHTPNNNIMLNYFTLAISLTLSFFVIILLLKKN
jgi:tetratricopeptide (TPR) repeat protein